MSHILNLINWEFALRLLVAGVCGIAVGLEREYRAKEAGYRTHFLVCVGSALMMIISKYAFWDLTSGHFLGVNDAVINSETINSSLRIDPGRIAAQVVTGIGFLGAGTIILHRQIVRGLTTAAGIWATGGIGMAVGAGMYWEAALATVLVLAGLEILTVLFGGLGVKALNVKFEVDKKATLDIVEKLFTDQEYIVVSYAIKEEREDRVVVETILKLKRRRDEKLFFSKLTSVPGLIIHHME